MSSTVFDPSKETPVVEAAQTNGTEQSNSEGLPHRFHEGLGNHPLWQQYMAELEASRQADIAEMNRLADLELEK